MDYENQIRSQFGPLISWSEYRDLLISVLVSSGYLGPINTIRSRFNEDVFDHPLLLVELLDDALALSEALRKFWYSQVTPGPNLNFYKTILLQLDTFSGGWNLSAEGGYINMTTYNSLAALIASANASFSRASSGLYLKASGGFQSFTSGNPRYHSSRGILIQPATTNEIKGSQQLASGGYWSANNCVITDDQVDLGGGAYLAELQRNGGAFGGPQQSKSLTNGQQYTYSCIIKKNDGGEQWFGVYNGTVASWQSLIQWTWPGSGAPTPVAGTGLVDAVSNINIETVDTDVYRVSYTSTFSGSPSDSTRLQLHCNRTTDLTSNYGGAFQLETGPIAHEYILSGASATTTPADTLTLFPSAGTYDITVTFDDDSTQVLSSQVVTGSGWAIPTSLDRPYIKNISAEAA